MAELILRDTCVLYEGNKFLPCVNSMSLVAGVYERIPETITAFTAREKVISCFTRQGTLQAVQILPTLHGLSNSSELIENVNNGTVLQWLRLAPLEGCLHHPLWSNHFKSPCLETLPLLTRSTNRQPLFTEDTLPSTHSSTAQEVHEGDAFCGQCPSALVCTEGSQCLPLELTQDKAALYQGKYDRQCMLSNCVATPGALMICNGL